MQQAASLASWEREQLLLAYQHCCCHCCCDVLALLQMLLV
jgi:hypothetical protein